MALKPKTHNLYQHFLILFSLVSGIPWQTQSSKDFQQTYSPIIKYHSLIPLLNSRRSRLSQGVFKQLSSLKTNKSAGLDGISARLLKDAAAIIAPTLTDIFNQSLKSSVFPKKIVCVPRINKNQPTYWIASKS